MSDIDRIPQNQYILIEGVYSVKKKKKKEHSHSESQIITHYDKIIPIFTNLDNWPMRTNIKCWFCDTGCIGWIGRRDRIYPRRGC